jgi:hypothetical protein
VEGEKAAHKIPSGDTYDAPLAVGVSLALFVSGSIEKTIFGRNASMYDAHHRLCRCLNQIQREVVYWHARLHMLPLFLLVSPP